MGRSDFNLAQSEQPGLGGRFEGEPTGDECLPQSRWLWRCWSGGMGVLLAGFWNLKLSQEEKRLLSAGFSRDVAPEPYDQEDCSQFESHHYCGGEGAL